MARVERSTSSGGKRYLTDKAVVFTDVEAKNIIVGGKDNTAGLIQVLDENGTLSVNIDKGGVTLSNGAEIIGGNGLVTAFVYNSNVISYNFLGGTCILPMAYSNTPVGYVKDSLQFDFQIPSNFTITSATIKLDHIPVKHYVGGVLQATGYSRNLKLYKATGFTSGYQSVDWQYATFITDNYGTWSEISSAFGASGFTGSSSGYTTTTSADVKSSLSVGFNTLRIQTGNALVTTDTAMYQQKGACNASLTIIGYYTYS